MLDRQARGKLGNEAKVLTAKVWRYVFAMNKSNAAVAYSLYK